jgi:hypothetical protein
MRTDERTHLGQGALRLRRHRPLCGDPAGIRRLDVHILWQRVSTAQSIEPLAPRAHSPARTESKNRADGVNFGICLGHLSQACRSIPVASRGARIGLDGSAVPLF